MSVSLDPEEAETRIMHALIDFTDRDSAGRDDTPIDSEGHSSVLAHFGMIIPSARLTVAVVPVRRSSLEVNRNSYTTSVNHGQRWNKDPSLPMYDHRGFMPPKRRFQP
jgi:hypothetical protein